MATTKPMLNKAQVETYVEKFGRSMYVEVEDSKQPKRELKVHTSRGGVLLGRVPKNVFKWFKLIPLSQERCFMFDVPRRVTDNQPQP